MRVEITYWCKASLRPGDVADLPDAVAAELIRDSHAKPVDAPDATAAPLSPHDPPAPTERQESDGQKARRGRLPVPAKPKPGDDEPVPE